VASAGLQLVKDANLVITALLEQNAALRQGNGGAAALGPLPPAVAAPRPGGFSSSAADDGDHALPLPMQPFTGGAAQLQGLRQSMRRSMRRSAAMAASGGGSPGRSVGAEEEEGAEEPEPEVGDGSAAPTSSDALAGFADIHAAMRELRQLQALHPAKKDLLVLEM
jgi:hypothetical protein